MTQPPVAPLSILPHMVQGMAVMSSRVCKGFLSCSVPPTFMCLSILKPHLTCHPGEGAPGRFPAEDAPDFLLLSAPTVTYCHFNSSLSVQYRRIWSLAAELKGFLLGFHYMTRQVETLLVALSLILSSCHSTYLYKTEELEEAFATQDVDNSVGILGRCASECLEKTESTACSESGEYTGRRKGKRQKPARLREGANECRNEQNCTRVLRTRRAYVCRDSPPLPAPLRDVLLSHSTISGRAAPCPIEIQGLHFCDLGYCMLPRPRGSTASR